MGKKIEEAVFPEHVSIKEQWVAKERLSPLTPIVICTLGYILCILLSVTPISRLAPVDLPLWLSRTLTRFGRWIPDDLHWATDHYVSRQNTGYMEFIVLMALAFTVYGVCAFFISRWKTHITTFWIMNLIWLGAVVSGCIYIFSPGLPATDLYSYASYGLILGIHHANPYFVPPSAFPHDPVYQFIYWKNTVSVYGPVWMAICALLGLVSGSDHTGFVFAFRLFAFAAHLFNILLVTTILRTMRRSPRTVALGALLYGWNPLVLFESSLGGHNDVFMLTFILLGVLFALRAEQGNTFRLHAYAPSVVAFTLAALIKFSAIPVILFFIVALFCRILHPLPSVGLSGGSALRWKSAFLSTISVSLLSVGIGFALYMPFWLGHSSKDIVSSFFSLPFANQAWNSILFTLSAWNEAHRFSPALSWLLERNLWSAINIGALALVMVSGILWLWRTPTIRTVVVVSLAFLTVFLIVTTWFFAWYVTWLVGLAALCLPVMSDRPGRALIIFTLLFSFTALLTYYSNFIGWFLLPNATWAVLICVALLVIPLLASITGFLRWPFAFLNREG